jgi:hypothetical protein
MSARALQTKAESAPDVARSSQRSRARAVAPPDAMTRRTGRPLDPSIRRTMEGRFGQDFGDVRVHADEHAAASAFGLDAAAYSADDHIVFGAGQYAPRSDRGARLIAHELAHVAQRRRTSDREGTSESALEADARQAADAAAGGGGANVCERAGSEVLRQAAGNQPAPQSRPQREERFNLGRGGSRVDAELDRSAGLLTAKMKVRFARIDAPTPWPSAARFTRFQSQFISAAQSRWSFKHYLAPAQACAGEPQLVAVRMQVIPVTSAPHFTVNVSYTTSFTTSSVGGRTGTFDVLDTAERQDQPQTPVEHEFGHMLGLPHIHCGRNDNECYGTTREERADVLGKGSYVSPRDYEPFAELMPYFTSCNYRVQQASQIPTSRAGDIGGAVLGFLGAAGLGAGGLALGGALFGPVGAAIGGLIGLVGGGLAGFFGGRALFEPDVPS